MQNMKKEKKLILAHINKQIKVETSHKIFCQVAKTFKTFFVCQIVPLTYPGNYSYKISTFRDVKKGDDVSILSAPSSWNFCEEIDRSSFKSVFLRFIWIYLHCYYFFIMFFISYPATRDSNKYATYLMYHNHIPCFNSDLIMVRGGWDLLFPIKQSNENTNIIVLPPYTIIYISADWVRYGRV